MAVNNRGISSSLFFASSIAILQSFLISIYVLFSVEIVHRTPLNSAYQDATEKAALAIADDLASITIENSKFGRLGLIDQEYLAKANGTVESPSICGFNTLYATLRLNILLAQKLNLPFMAELAKEDLKTIRQAQFDIAKSLSESIEPNYYLKEKNYSIFQNAHQIILSKEKSGNEHLIDFKVKLGSTSDQDFQTLTPCPKLANELSAPYSKAGNYLPNKLVPIPAAEPVYFYPLARKSSLAKVDSFEATTTNVLPSVVLVEATFKENSNGQAEKIIRRSACAVIGSKGVKFPSLAFMFSFPHGLPPKCKNVLATLSSAGAENQGNWLQAIAGSVPGQGSLNPPLGINVKAANPEQSMTMALYHWLIALGPSVSPDNINQLFSEPFVSRTRALKAQTLTISNHNSALVKNTGASSFAIMFQSQPKNIGQEILKQAFSSTIGNNYFPNSAIPLYIDKDSHCNLPGNIGFDNNLVTEFIQSLYQTNLAGIETHTEAKNLAQKLETDINNMLSGRELSQINEPNRTRIAKKQELLSQINQIVRNTNKVAFDTFELCNKLSNNTYKGLVKVTTPKYGFLLNNRTLFVPMTKTFSAREILLSIERQKEEGFSLARQNFSVLENIDNTATQNENITYHSAEPVFFVLKSSELISARPAKLTILDFSPFADSGITEQQLFYYAPNSINTGNKPAISWSTLIRDLVVFKSENSNNTPSSQIAHWCHQNENILTVDANCPALAGEIQIRSPIPILPDLKIGSYLTNPYNQDKISPLPPMPAQML